VLHLVVRQGGTAGRAPVHQVIAFIEKIPFVEGDKDLPHRPGKALVHGKAFPGPVHAGPHPGKLPGDDGVVFVLDLPGLLHELFPSQVVTAQAPGAQPLFHHVLRGDAGVIGARHPEGPLRPACGGSG